MPTTYTYNPHKHVKIWLSKNPNVFMNLENQIRLSEMRVKNPSDTIHLVYDSHLLNEKANIELIEYCKSNNLIPVDVNKLNQDLLTENEKALLEKYKDEVDNLDNGGNLAAASDIIRWISPIYKLGSYTDLDVPVNTTNLPSTIEVHVPLLVNLGSIKIGNKDIILPNNDYVAVVDADAAKKDIERIQTGILSKLNNYSSDFIEKTVQEIGTNSRINRMVIEQIKNRSEAVYIAKTNKLNSSMHLSSRKLRQYTKDITTSREKFLDFKRKIHQTDADVIQALRKELENQLSLVKLIFFKSEYIKIRTILLQNDDEFIKQLMKREYSQYLSSIIVCTTGPLEIARSLFGSSVLDTTYFNTHARAYSFKEYGLQKYFLTENTIRVHENVISLLIFLGTDTGTLNDSSWLPEGISLQSVREADILDRIDNFKANLPKHLNETKAKITKQLNYLRSLISNKLADKLFHRRINNEIKALERLLDCYSDNDNSFDLDKFQSCLTDNTVNIHGRFSSIFHRRSHQLINTLESISHDAQVFNMATNRKIDINGDPTSSKNETKTTTTKIASNKDIVGLLNSAIARLGEINSTFDLKKSFIPALESLSRKINNINDKQSRQVAEETIRMIEQLENLKLYESESECNLVTKKYRMIKCIHDYDLRCYDLTRESRIIKAVSMVIAGAIGFILGMTVGAGFGFLAGAWTGPGALVTSLVGLFYGAYSGAAVGITCGAALTAATTASISRYAFFKPHSLRYPAHEVASSLFPAQYPGDDQKYKPF